MKRLTAFLFFAVLMNLISEPLFLIDFEKKSDISSNRHPNLKKFEISRDLFISGLSEPGGGYNRSAGLLCSKKYGSHAVNFPCQDWRTFTMEGKFSLNKTNKPAKRSLFGLALTTYNTAAFMLRITADQQLEAEFNLSHKGRKKSLKLYSDPVQFVPGKYYTVRVASESGGRLKIWLDGRLVASREQGALGMNDIAIPMPLGYPLLVLGYDLIDPQLVCRPLEGILDDIQIWNQFVEPDLFDNIGGTASDHLAVKVKQTVRTSAFHVLDRPGRALGSFMRPEKKFLDAASTAEVTLTEGDLIVKIACPIAAGTKLNMKSGSVWGGDLVEFFIRPDISGSSYFQYAANSLGTSTGISWKSPGTSDTSFSTQAKIRSEAGEKVWNAEFVIPRKELGLQNFADGRIVAVNFTRTGKTGGGLSTWALLENFSDIDKFQPLILGSRKKALLQQLEVSRQEFLEIGGKGKLRDEISAELDKIEKKIQQNGDDPIFFTGLLQTVKNMSQRYTALRFAGMTSFIWSPLLPWSNKLSVTPLSRKAEKIKLTIGMNSYDFVKLSFTNLSDKSFLGQIKCFPRGRSDSDCYDYFNSFGKIYRQHFYRQTALHRNIKFFELLPLDSGAGGQIYEPLVPLPMNTLVRAGARETRQIWMRISTEDMKPGKQNLKIFLKPSYPGFDIQQVHLELDIRPVDASVINLDAGHYTYLYGHGLHGEIKNFFGERKINMLSMGMGGVLNNYYPKIDKEGNIISYNDYAGLDAVIDKNIAGGVPRNQVKLYFIMQLSVYGLAGRPPEVRYNSPVWNKAFKAFLDHFSKHVFEKYGITRNRIIFSTVDEPEGDIHDKKSSMYQALLQAQIIKRAGKEYVTMVNPHPRVLSAFTEKKEDLLELLKYYDIIELYRPGVNAAVLEFAKVALRRGKQIWTYSILDKKTPPDVYRRNHWQNMRDGFSSMVRYWQLEGSDSNDGFSSMDGVDSRVDYGTIYVDREMGTWLSGRRQEAHDLGREDFRLATFCRRLLQKKSDAAVWTKFEDIVKRGAEGNMQEMDQARLDLLELAEEIQKNSK